jgi:hypothetical protein
MQKRLQTVGHFVHIAALHYGRPSSRMSITAELLHNAPHTNHTRISAPDNVNTIFHQGNTE